MARAQKGARTEGSSPSLAVATAVLLALSLSSGGKPLEIKPAEAPAKQAASLTSLPSVDGAKMARALVAAEIVRAQAVAASAAATAALAEAEAMQANESVTAKEHGATIREQIARAQATALAAAQAAVNADA